LFDEKGGFAAVSGVWLLELAGWPTACALSGAQLSPGTMGSLTASAVELTVPTSSAEVASTATNLFTLLNTPSLRSLLFQSIYARRGRHGSMRKGRDTPKDTPTYQPVEDVICPYTSGMADEDTVLEEAMDTLKEAGQRIRATQSLMRSQGMTDGENHRDLLTRLSTALDMTEAAYLEARRRRDL
jgi:hypothetical protein